MTVSARQDSVFDQFKEGIKSDDDSFNLLARLDAWLVVAFFVVDYNILAVGHFVSACI